VQRSNPLVLVAGQLQKGFFFMRNFRLEALAAMNNPNLMNIMSTNPTLPSLDSALELRRAGSRDRLTWTSFRRPSRSPAKSRKRRRIKKRQFYCNDSRAILM
jgi:hypothetical protein